MYQQEIEFYCTGKEYEKEYIYVCIYIHTHTIYICIIETLCYIAVIKQHSHSTIL